MDRDVAFGSRTTDLRYSCDFRFNPNRRHIAAPNQMTKWANSDISSISQRPHVSPNRLSDFLGEELGAARNSYTSDRVVYLKLNGSVMIWSRAVERDVYRSRPLASPTTTGIPDGAIEANSNAIPA